MFSSFLKSTGIIESPIDYKTIHSDLAYNDLSAIRVIENDKNEHGEENDLEEIDKELVLRSFDTIFGMGADVTKEQAMTLCSKHLELNPYNDFFAFALALLTDSVTFKQELLEKVVQSPREDKTIIAQAAVELSKLYIKKKMYLESQAWLFFAVLNNNVQARDLYTESTRPNSDVVNALKNQYPNVGVVPINGLLPYNGKYYVPSYIFSLQGVSNVIMALSGKPEYQSPMKDITDAINTTYNLNPNLFKSFFDYCLKNKIITDVIYNSVNDSIEKHSCIQTTSTYASVLYPQLQPIGSSSCVNTNNNHVYTFPGISEDDLVEISKDIKDIDYINTNELENLPSVPQHTINIYPQTEEKQAEEKQRGYGF